ncbi:MAG: copper chaperone PCu(A)C [Parvularculaceae bacterium]
MRLMPILAPVSAGLLLLSACAKGDHEAVVHTETASNCSAAAGGAVTATGATMREQLDTEAMSAAYFTICNGSEDAVTIDDVTTPVAGEVELHETSRDAEGRVSMHALGELTLQPGEEVVFKQGGKHAMLMDLQQQLKSGETAPLTLHFSNGDKATVEAPIMSPTEMATHKH